MLPAWRPILKLRCGYKLKFRSLLDALIIKEVCIDNDYERVGFKPSDGWNIVDIGAGIGEYAIHLAKRFPNSKILAFEPNPETFEVLKGNLKLNQVLNVTAINRAVTGSKSSELYLGKNPSLDSTVHDSLKTKIKIESLTLEEVLSGSHCDLLKMDCEGAEYDILFASSVNTLGMVKRIVLEWHDLPSRSHYDLVKFLESNNFKVKIEKNPIKDSIGFLAASNSLFASDGNEINASFDSSRI